MASPMLNEFSQAELHVESAQLQQSLSEALEELTEIEQSLEERGDYSLGEGDPAVHTWEVNMVLYQRVKERVDSLRAALRRIEEGTFGICMQCGSRIDKERLEIVADASLCIACARLQGE